MRCGVECRRAEQIPNSEEEDESSTISSKTRENKNTWNEILSKYSYWCNFRDFKQISYKFDEVIYDS